MSVLVYEYKHFCIEDICESFERYGYDVVRLKCEIKDRASDKNFEENFEKALEKIDCDFVFSFNYYPVISNLCKKFNLKYVSWVYDSPLIVLYSYTVINSCNYIFLFDTAVYQELKSVGINTVYYLPLAVNTSRIDRLIQNNKNVLYKYKCDVAFVGSMYNEKKHSLYARLYSGLSDYMKGYIDGIVRVQYDLYGISLLEKAIDTDFVIKELQKSIDVQTNPDGVETPAYTYANYFLARRVTELERRDIITKISESNPVQVYTNENGADIGQGINKGQIDYYDTMPLVFNGTKINLNITLKSIKNGIPLRCFDILGSGGFLLTNYQADMLEYFVPDEDFVYYNSIGEAKELVEYYLSNEEKRKNIARNGYEKVKKYHNFDERVKKIIECITS